MGYGSLDLGIMFSQYTSKAQHSCFMDRPRLDVWLTCLAITLALAHNMLITALTGHAQLHAQVVQEPRRLALAPLLSHGPLLLPYHLPPLLEPVLPLLPHPLRLLPLFLQSLHLLLPLVLVLVEIHEARAPRPRLGAAIEMQLRRRRQLLVPLGGQVGHLLRDCLVRVEGVGLHGVAVDELLGHGWPRGEAVGGVVGEGVLAALFAGGVGAGA